MDSGHYVAVSAQLALERRMVTIASNVANAATPGFRAEGVSFSTVVSRTTPFRTEFASHGRSHIDPRSGSLVETGNPLDVAITGEGFLAIRTPEGTAYTRDGRMQMLPSGDLVSLAGHPVLDDGGAPVSLDPDAGPPTISRDGRLIQGGRAAGVIGLFALDLSKPMRRTENAAFIAATPPEPITDFAHSGLVQGFVETANVSAIHEMTRLIAVTRAFEAVAAGLERRDALLRDAIQTLGART